MTVANPRSYGYAAPRPVPLRPSGIPQPTARPRPRVETVEEVVRRTIPYSRRVFPAAAALCVAAVAWAFLDGGTARGSGLAAVAVGALAPIGLWIYKVGRTLPLVAVLASQDLLWYGLPLLVGHDELRKYSDSDLNGAAVSLAIYFAALSAGYWLAVRRRRPTPGAPLVIDVFSRGGRRRVVFVALSALALCAVAEAGLLLGWFTPILERLPQGSMNVIQTCLAAAICGTTLFLAHEAGRGALRGPAAWLFGLLWAAVFFVQIASILLSSTVATAGALVFGLYLGSGKVPWKTIAAVGLTLAFFNLSKFEMRGRYWDWGEGKVELRAADLPGYFAEWSGRSVDLLTGGGGAPTPGWGSAAPEPEGQSLLERVSNIQMLLYVRERLDRGGYQPLNGETYAVVWQAVVPRVLWEEKPRSHIGQEILNVHFGMQTREQTFKTYIAWGLLPEAVGNFGGLLGPAAIGLFLGLCGGWVEARTGPLPLFSPWAVLAGFLILSVVAASGMVMSVWASSLFQMGAVLLASLAPFVRRLR